MPEEEEYEEAIESLANQNKELQNKNLGLHGVISGSQFLGQQNDNLIKYQLDTDAILERIEHFLKGDVIKVDDITGNVYYEVPEDKNEINFNRYGVNEFMRIISMYVTKETFLSLYEEIRINEIIGDLGDALTDFLFCNYEKMGMDTKFKESKFTLIVLNILHTIENCYRRALGGAEQENIKTRAIVTQSQPLGYGGGGMPRSVPKKKWNPFDKTTW